ncbi:hypothetical protein GCM10010464_08510 [Pseudonocardia yunnanensis]
MLRVHRDLIVLLALVIAIVTGTMAAQPVAAQPSSHPTAAPDKGPVGWDTYRRLDRLPELTTGVRTSQFSSSDRTGGNTDWWSNPNQCLRLNGTGAEPARFDSTASPRLRTRATQCVVAEHSGPGEVDAIWFTWAGGNVAGVGNITITLDGRQIMHAPLQDVVNGKLGAPFVYPLVANADQSSGGVYIAVPMPFTSHMLITTDSSSFYYHVTYRTFADASAVSTFDPSDRATDVLALLRAAGTRDPKPPLPAATTSTTAVGLAPGATQTIGTARGPGELTAVRLRLPQAHYVVPRAVTDAGRTFGKGGSSTFTIKIDPNNNGVVLTRRLDPGIANQAATVSVDSTVVASWAANGVSAAELARRAGATHWPYAGAPAARVTGDWVEQSVSLPATVTAGRSQITIKNTFAPSDRGFTEFHYWVDSVVNGTSRPTDEVDVGNAADETAHAYLIAGQTWSGVRTYQEPLSAAQLADLHTAQQLLQGVRLRIRVDGQTLVDSPVGEFFGSGFGVQPVASLMFGMDVRPGGWYSAWWPMPYLRGATVTLYNGSSIAVSGAQAQVSQAPDARLAAELAAGRIGYFRTSSHAGSTTPKRDWPYLTATGTGKFVGDTVDMQGPVARDHLEGDERVYTDGSQSPQIHGTGTEDYYESGWFFNRGTYNTPLHGNTAHLTPSTGCAASTDCTSAFRLWLAEAVPFHNTITFGIEHGPVDDVSADYSSTAYWYGRTQATAR